MSKYDVIVVGAGPAGIFACYELTRKAPHWKVLLVDKGHDIYRVITSYSIHYTKLYDDKPGKRPFFALYAQPGRISSRPIWDRTPISEFAQSKEDRRQSLRFFLIL